KVSEMAVDDLSVDLQELRGHGANGGRRRDAERLVHVLRDDCSDPGERRGAVLDRWRRGRPAGRFGGRRLSGARLIVAEEVLPGFPDRVWVLLVTPKNLVDQPDVRSELASFERHPSDDATRCRPTWRWAARSRV